MTFSFCSHGRQTLGKVNNQQEMEWNHSTTKYFLFFSLLFSPCFPFFSKPLHTSYFMNNGNFTWWMRCTSTLYSQQRLVNYILLQTLITIGPSHPYIPIYNTTGSKLSTNFYFRGFKTRNQIRYYFTLLNQLKYIS